VPITTYLSSTTIAFLSGLQEGVSTHRAPKDAVGGGCVQQTGRVHLLQERGQLFQTAAAELLCIYVSTGSRKDPL